MYYYPMMGYGYGLGYGLDPTYILVLIGAIITTLASLGIKSTYAKYSRVRSASGMTGAQTAERLLRQAGIYDVRVEHISGQLTDHYDPRSKVVRLSDAVYGSASVAAVGVAAHECGHAIQHQVGYVPLQFRSALVPLANIGSRLGLPIIIIGLIAGLDPIVSQIGILIFSASVLFQIVTLPVEFNASSRALRALEDYGILGHEELRHSRKVLSAAAMTYVASAAASILSLLRLILLTQRRNNRR